MTPAITALRMTGAAHRAELPLLVLGPAAGTSAAALWSGVAAGLTDHFDVLAWDLPGQGHNRSVPDEPYSTAELAAGVLAVVTDVQEQRDDLAAPFAYAGAGLGADVGLHLLLEQPPRVRAAVLLGSGGGADGELDVLERLGAVGAPVLAVAGVDDPVTTLEHLTAVAVGVGRGAVAEVPGSSDVAPTERPDEVAMLVRRHVLGHGGSGTDDGSVPALWSRPGLDARSRAVATLTALTVLGRHDELAAHLRAAVDAGLVTDDETDELLVQATTYCGPGEADAAFRTARQVLRNPGG